MQDYQSPSNVLRLTIISYLLAVVSGATLVFPFVLKEPAALYFHSTLSATGFAFSFFMAGVVVLQYFSGHIVKWINIRSQIWLIILIYLLCCISLYQIHSLVLLAILLFVIGGCFGLTFTLPSFIVVHTFEGPKRSSQMNRLDLFFSIGALLSPILAACLITQRYTWQDVYVTIFVPLLLTILLTFCTQFPDVNIDRNNDKSQFSHWHSGIYLAAFALFLYCVSYIGFTYWLRILFHLNFKMSYEVSAIAVTVFWTFYAIGCWVSSYAVKLIQVNKYIIGSACVALIDLIFMLTIHNPITGFIATAILGLALSTIFSSSIAYGTLLVKHPSPCMVSFFVAFANLGSMVGEAYTSFVQQRFGITAVTVCSIAILIVVIGIFIYLAKTREIMHN